ncbi:5297_t:CDS:2, partial [Funneliformis mosseae]
MHDHHLQCPHDAFHCMGGLAKEMLQSTFEILSSKGETEFLKVWHNFEFPPYWSRQQNPITHLGSYFFSDYLRLSMIMPFLINRVLHITMLNKTFVEYMIKTCTITKSQVLDKLLGLWYNTIVQTGCEVNISVAMKEMVHRLFKAIIPHSNKKNIELDFMHRDNCLQALRFLMDSGIDERYDKTTYFNFSILSKDRCVRMLLDSCYISLSIIDSEQEEIYNITSYNKNDLRTAGFEKVLNDDLFAELRYAYKEEFDCVEHLTSQTVKYFNSISYTIVDNDDRVDVNLCVGDTVDVLEDISNDTLNNPKT